MTDIEIRLSGSGGQGILLACRILAEALTIEGMRTAQSQHYEPTSRGGLSRSDLVAGRGAIDYPLASRLDYLVVLDQVAAAASNDLLHSGSMVLIDTTQVTDPDGIPGRHIPLPLGDTARALNDVRSANMVAIGALVALSGLCSLATLEQAIGQVTPRKLVASSTDAARAGHAIAPNQISSVMS